jgi:predicted enzyme related to lactoylglutathione lyase
MSSPIQNRIGSVFIPVSNMGRAVDWYSKLLNLPVTQTSHEGAIYDVPMAGETGLLLDSTKPEVRNSSQPLFFFLTENIQSVYEFLRQNAVEIVSQIEDIGSVYTLTFKDPDNNLLMVCQRKA